MGKRICAYLQLPISDVQNFTYVMYLPPLGTAPSFPSLRRNSCNAGSHWPVQWTLPDSVGRLDRRIYDGDGCDGAGKLRVVAWTPLRR